MVTPTTWSPVSYVGPVGDYRIDALLKGSKWGGPVGTGVDLTYGFPQTGSEFSTSNFGGYGPPGGGGEPWDPDYAGFNATQRAYFGQAINTWAEVANISVTQVADNANVVGDIRAAFTGVVQDVGAAAFAYYPNPSSIGGDNWYNPFLSQFNNPIPGEFGYYAFIHELGHALGLTHNFSGGMDTFGGVEDTHQYSVMSYTNYGGVNKYPTTPMLYDLLAIQYLYGANYSTRAGNTNYTFSSTSENFKTIWDGGGIDTLDASNQSLPVNISLVAGTFSSIGPKAFSAAAQDNIAIAFGVTIENANGGSGDDTIVGNDGVNLLQGFDGNDRIDGFAGADTLDGGPGDDTLIGLAGDDFLDGGADFDRVWYGAPFADFNITFVGTTGFFEYIGANPGTESGTDTVVNAENFGFSDRSYSLEQLMELFGGPGPTGDEHLIGDAADNVLEGFDGNDRLDGLGGNDSLFGGAGNDTLLGQVGDDFIDGGADYDRVWFGGPFADFAITFVGSTGFFEYIGSDPRFAGTDTIVNAERFGFSDSNYSVEELIDLFGVP
jgi:serralysin